MSCFLRVVGGIVLTLLSGILAFPLAWGLLEAGVPAGLVIVLCFASAVPVLAFVLHFARGD